MSTPCSFFKLKLSLTSCATPTNPERSQRVSIIFTFLSTVDFFIDDKHKHELRDSHLSGPIKRPRKVRPHRILPLARASISNATSANSSCSTPNLCDGELKACERGRSPATAQFHSLIIGVKKKKLLSDCTGGIGGLDHHPKKGYKTGTIRTGY